MSAGIESRLELWGVWSPARSASHSSKFVSGFALFVLFGAFGCTGTPGLEPPWRDDDDGEARRPTVGPPSFGNGSLNSPMSPVIGAAGTASAPGGSSPPGSNDSGSEPQPAQPSAMAGAAAEPPPAQGGPTDPMTPAADAGMPPPFGGFEGLDLKPECSAETSLVLTADGVCSFPLPDDVELTGQLTEIALVSNGQFSLVSRVDGPLECELLNGGFYFDMSESPARVSLCTTSCLRAGASAEMQVVLVLGCEPPAP